MADDKDQSRFEVLKLRVEFFKHMTTLSGVATVIVLTLAARTDAHSPAVGMAFAAGLFALATVISVLAMTAMIDHVDSAGVDNVRQSIGSKGASFVMTLFCAGVTVLVIAAFRIPLWPTIGVLFAAVVLSYGANLYWRRNRA